MSPSVLNLRLPMLAHGIGATPCLNASEADTLWRITNNLPRKGRKP